MNWRFHWLYRALLVAFAVMATWMVAAQITQDTNAPAANLTVTPATAPSLLHHIRLAEVHPLSFGLDRVDFLTDNEVLNQPLWKYLASLIYILLALVVSRLLDWVVNVWLRRVAARHPSPHTGLLLELLRGPVKVVTLVIFLQIGLNLFDWPDRAQLYLSRGFVLIAAVSLTYLALKLLDLFLGLWRERLGSIQDRAFAEQLFPLLRKVAKTVILLSAVMVTAEYLEFPIKSLLAGLSIGGLALGLAAQDTVANLFGAVAIFLDRPFHLGDQIKVEGVSGKVEAIGLRSTRVRNDDGALVTIPNKLMGNAIITNVTRRPSIKTEINLGLVSDTPADRVERATALLTEIFRANPRTRDLIISFNRITDSALNLTVLHEWGGTDDKARLADLQAFNLEIKRRFDAEGLRFAHPTRTVLLRSTQTDKISG